MLVFLGYIALIVVVVLAAISDVLWRRIPNVLTMSTFVAALGLRAALGGDALVAGLLGAGLAFVVVLPLFAARGIGGGDAKLLIVVGAFLGPQAFVVAGLATAIVGGLLSLVAAARKGVLLPVLFNTRDLLFWMLSFGRRGVRTTLVSPGVVSIPYAVSIAIGSVVALYVGGGL